MSASIPHILPIVLPRTPPSLPPPATATPATKPKTTAPTEPAPCLKATGAIPKRRPRSRTAITRRPITVNLLPCGIKTATWAPAGVARGYWRPRLLRPRGKREGDNGRGGGGVEEGADTMAESASGSRPPAAGTNNITPYEATFRGRRLLGRRVPMPDGYAGHIISLTPGVGQCERGLDEDVGAEVEEQSLGNQLVALAQFDELLVWGHEQVPEEWNDPVVRSLGEWVAFAGRVNLVEGV